MKRPYEQDYYLMFVSLLPPSKAGWLHVRSHVPFGVPILAIG